MLHVDLEEALKIISSLIGKDLDASVKLQTVKTGNEVSLLCFELT